RRGAMRLAGEFACYHVYRCADERWVTVGALEPQFWEALCKALGVPEMIERQFSPPEEQDLMIARLAEIFAARTRDEWVADLADLDACFGPVKDMEEAFADEQLLARGMVIEAPTPEGTVRAIGNPVHLVGDERPSPRPAPDFGEHTNDVLRAAGYDDARIEQLRATGAI
ncbi:MAG TPA: CoA transferase, partial [Actinomycetota bacterium]